MYPRMLSYRIGSQEFTKQITMIGVDEATYATVSDFGQYLQHPGNRKQLSFQLKDGGYDTLDHQATDSSKVQERSQMHGVGWPYRKRKAEFLSRISVPEDALKADPWQQQAVKSNAAAKDGTAGAGPTSDNTTFDPAQ